VGAIAESVAVISHRPNASKKAAEADSDRTGIWGIGADAILVGKAREFELE
jgi:hypothetical protein